MQSASTYLVLRSGRGQDGYPHVQSHDYQHGFNEPFPRLGYLNANQLSGHLHSTRKHRGLLLRATNNSEYCHAVGPLIGPPLAQHRPGDTRELVCQGHDHDIALDASGQRNRCYAPTLSSPPSVIGFTWTSSGSFVSIRAGPQDFEQRAW